MKMGVLYMGPGGAEAGLHSAGAAVQVAEVVAGHAALLAQLDAGGRHCYEDSLESLVHWAAAIAALLPSLDASSNPNLPQRLVGLLLNAMRHYHANSKKAA